jgi:hypothetical protein
MLRDIMQRLHRDENGLNSRFSSMIEIPNFQARFHEASFMIKVAIFNVIITLHGQNEREKERIKAESAEKSSCDAGDAAEKDKNLITDELTTTSLAEFSSKSKDSMGNQEKADTMEQSVLSYAGVAATHSNEFKQSMFLAAVKVLAGFGSSLLPKMAYVLGIVSVQLLKSSQKGSVFPEPKFW